MIEVGNSGRSGRAAVYRVGRGGYGGSALFERFASSVDFRRGSVSFNLPSMPEAMAFLETNPGSVVAARKILAPAQYEEMTAELESLAVELNRGEGEEVSNPSEYLMIVARKGQME